jgi:hypothetical protein
MGTTQVNMQEAISRLSELGELALKGEKIVIAKAGKPYLDLIPHRGVQGQRRPGRLAGQIRIGPDFDETPPALLSDFEGSP